MSGYTVVPNANRPARSLQIRPRDRQRAPSPGPQNRQWPPSARARNRERLSWWEDLFG